MKLKKLFTIAFGLAMTMNIYADNQPYDDPTDPAGTKDMPRPHRAPRRPAVTVDNFRTGRAIILPNKDLELVEIEYYKNGCLVKFENYVSVEASSALIVSSENTTADSFAVIVNGKMLYADNF